MFRPRHPAECHDLVWPSPQPEKGDMAAIDHATCGINDIITHSLNSHPRLLADCLRLLARVHAEFADAYNDGEVMRNEIDLAGRLHALAHAIEVGDHTLPDDSDVRRGAFSCAARLQDLHPFAQSLIAERDQAWSRSARGEAAQFSRHDLA
jgi:hypothetical protein